MASTPSVERFRACILGGALGDALGCAIEFRAAASILASFGAGAPADLVTVNPEGWVTDDTQMTLFTIEGLVRGGSITALHEAYLRWLATQRRAYLGRVARTGWLLEEPRLFAERAPGNTCLSALEWSVESGGHPSVERPINDSKGCGAVMRSAPFGLAARDREGAFRLARDAGALTHGHPSGYLSAACFAAIVFDLARGEGLDDAIDRALSLLGKERAHEETRAAIEAAREVSEPPSPDRIERLGKGWIGEEALAIGIACARTCTGADALWRSVAHGGDSDSTGSITGNLLGVMHGMSALPERWLEQLEMRDVIDRAARDLWAHAIEGAAPDPVRYPAG